MKKIKQFAYMLIGTHKNQYGIHRRFLECSVNVGIDDDYYGFFATTDYEMARDKKKWFLNRGFVGRIKIVKVVINEIK